MSLLQRQDWLVLSFWCQHVSKLFSADLCISVTRDSGLHSSWRLEHRNTHKFGQGAARTSSSVGEITFCTWFLYSHIILHIISCIYIYINVVRSVVTLSHLQVSPRLCRHFVQRLDAVGDVRKLQVWHGDSYWCKGCSQHPRYKGGKLW